MAVDSISEVGQPQLSGDVTLSEGTGITLTQVGQDIEIAATAAAPVAGMRAWYDAADVASLTIVSNKVSAWNDLSGNGHHLAQAVAADRPLYNAAPRLINGITCPEFTDSREWLDSTCPVDDRTSSHFIVALLDDFNDPTLLGSAGGTGGFECRVDSLARPQILKAGIAFLTAQTAMPLHTVPAFGLVYIFCARMDAATIYMDLPDASFSQAEATTFTAGRTLRLGADNAVGAQALDGLIAEYLNYDSKLSDADMRTNFGYLFNKWFV